MLTSFDHVIAAARALQDALDAEEQAVYDEAGLTRSIASVEEEIAAAREGATDVPPLSESEPRLARYRGDREDALRERTLAVANQRRALQDLARFAREALADLDRADSASPVAA